MIRVLKEKDLKKVSKIIKEYKEENNSLLSQRTDKELLNIINQGYMYGKFIKKELIGIVSFIEYDQIKSLSKTNKKNKESKTRFIEKNNILKENSVLLLNDLIIPKYRGKGFFLKLHNKRIKKIKKLKYENIIVYKSIDNIDGINHYLFSGWSVGSLIHINKNQYELLLHYKNKF